MLFTGQIVGKGVEMQRDENDYVTQIQIAIKYKHGGGTAAL